MKNHSSPGFILRPTSQAALLTVANWSNPLERSWFVFNTEILIWRCVDLKSHENLIDSWVFGHSYVCWWFYVCLLSWNRNYWTTSFYHLLYRKYLLEEQQFHHVVHWIIFIIIFTSGSLNYKLSLFSISFSVSTLNSLISLEF